MEGGADGDLLPLWLVKLKIELDVCLALPVWCRGEVSLWRQMCNLPAQSASVIDAMLQPLADLHRRRRIAVFFVAWGCFAGRSRGVVDASVQTTTNQLGVLAQASDDVSIKQDIVALSLCFLAWRNLRPGPSQNMEQAFLSEAAVQTDKATVDVQLLAAVAAATLHQTRMWSQICLSAWRNSVVLQTCSRMCLAQAAEDDLHGWSCIILWAWRLLASSGRVRVLRRRAMLHMLSLLLLAWHRAAVAERRLQRLRYVEPSEVLSAAIVGPRRAYRAVPLPLSAEQMPGVRVAHHQSHAEPIQSFVDRTWQTDGDLYQQQKQEQRPSQHKQYY